MQKNRQNAVFFHSFQIKGGLIFAYLKNFLYLCWGIEHGLMEIARTGHLHSAGQRRCTKQLAGHGTDLSCRKYAAEGENEGKNA